MRAHDRNGPFSAITEPITSIYGPRWHTAGVSFVPALYRGVVEALKAVIRLACAIRPSQHDLTCLAWDRLYSGNDYAGTLDESLRADNGVIDELDEFSARVESRNAVSLHLSCRYCSVQLPSAHHQWCAGLVISYSVCYPVGHRPVSSSREFSMGSDQPDVGLLAAFSRFDRSAVQERRCSPFPRVLGYRPVLIAALRPRSASNLGLPRSAHLLRRPPAVLA